MKHLYYIKYIDTLKFDYTKPYEAQDWKYAAIKARSKASACSKFIKAYGDYNYYEIIEV